MTLFYCIFLVFYRCSFIKYQKNAIESYKKHVNKLYLKAQKDSNIKTKSLLLKSACSIYFYVFLLCF